MKTPHVIIFSGYGLNCEDETKTAFEMAGGAADIVHINDIRKNPAILKRYQIAAFPGGFSYGDDTGSGKAYGNALKNHLGSALQEFLARDTLMIGICNGFQIITNAGILPGALTGNDNARYLTRWVDLEIKSTSPWFTGVKRMSLPIAHGEGKYAIDATGLARLKKEGVIALTYAKAEICEYFDLPANPNGSLEDIAGITGYGGRVLGLMPHAERAVRFTQLPNWTFLKEKALREGTQLHVEGMGLQVFKNAVQYFT